ncbi:MAG: PD-(D/E)XK nuclease family protein [Thermosynechococcaceae cyanobacterium]
MDLLPHLFQLSQTHLQVLETCPRRFQYLFLDRLALPRLSADSEQQRLGTQFHRLMQQQELGLEVEPLLAANPVLQQWFQRFQICPPPLLSGQRLSEHQRTLVLYNFLMVAIYDLLVLGPDQAQIIDWKTYRRPLNPQVLQQHWQTRLYPFLLVETSAYAPSQVSMIYWFAEPADPSASQGHWTVIPYSEQRHQETYRLLARLLPPLDSWIQSWGPSQPSLPQAPISAGHCGSADRTCPFVSQCQRTPNNVESLDLTALTDLEAIAEIPLN